MTQQLKTNKNKKSTSNTTNKNTKEIEDRIGSPVLKERLKQTTTTAGYNGTTSPVSTTVPKVGGSGGLFGLGGIFSIGGSGADNDRFAIVMSGETSNIKKTKVLGVSGNYGGSSGGSLISIGGPFGINIG